MEFFKKLFRKKDPEWHVTLNLNARLMPFDRGDIFEDPIDGILREAGIGETDGGGTLMSKTGEIESCDVEIYLVNKDADISVLRDFLARTGVPKGSFLISENGKEEIGDLEGLALYLNGTDLDKSVYESCDINHLISELERGLGEECRYRSYMEGPEETALYFYGPSFRKMNELISPIVSEYPLCEKSRIVQIA